MWSMNLFFVHSYLTSKIETKEKMEKKVNMRLKNSFSNDWLNVRFNLSSDDVINCKETTSVKERNPQFDV